jgi:endo-1,4-beta-mannosidase
MRYLRPGGRPRFLLGANYWSRAGGPRMWERFDEDVVAAELAQLSAIGCNALRAFAFVPSFAPRPPAVEATALARLRRLLELAASEELCVLPSILVGHMSGENYDFPGQGSRSLYQDAELLGWQEALCAAVADTLSGQPALGAFVLSNEMPLWGGSADAEVVRAWARRLAGALRATAPGVPVGTGDGVMNLKGGENGFDPALLRDIVDYLGPHAYHTDRDPYRQALNAEFLVRALEGHGLPVLLEEFGASSSQAGELEQAAYLREVMHGCLAIGAAGALCWCYSDLALADEPPYSHHAFELGFGLTRSDGTEKPACAEIRRLAGLIASLDLDLFLPETPRAAILVPRYFQRQFPFSFEGRARMRRTLLQAFALCARAGFEVRLVPEDAPLSDYRLLLLPATQKLLAPTWERIERAVRAGAHLYHSYFAGDRDFHQGLWCHNFTALTGLAPALRYGCFDVPPDTIEIVGDGLRLRASTAGGEPWSRSFLPVRAVDAEVVARDAGGRPALTRRRLDAGQVTFAPYPLEYYQGEQSDVNETDEGFRIYRRVAEQAGVLSTVPSDPRVSLHHARHGDEEIAWLMNRSWGPVRMRAGDLFDGELGPKETRVIRRR